MYANTQYEHAFNTLVQDICETKASDLISVVISENANIGTKRQWVGRLPVHTQVEPYETRAEFKSEYDRRTHNTIEGISDEFNQLRRIALTFEIPQQGENSPSHLVVNPDIREDLRSKASPVTGYQYTQSKGNNNFTDEKPLPKGAQHAEQIQDISQGAMKWYVGRAVQHDDPPFDGSGDFDHFGLRTYLFGQIAPYVESWENPELELTIDTGVGWHLEGDLFADELTLGYQFTNAPTKPVSQILKEEIELELLAILQYSQFNWQPVTRDDIGGAIGMGDAGGNSVDVGAGGTEYDDVEPAEALDPKYENPERSVGSDDSFDWRVWNFIDDVTVEAPIDEDANRIEFRVEDNS